ncbi:MAG TPA: hypothetical protein VGF28_05420 [Thermoanaerobaculia bacterium]
MIAAAAAVAASIAAPLLVLRRRTLWAYYGADAATWLFAYILWRRLPVIDPRLGCIALGAVKLATLSLFVANGREVRWSATRAAALAGIVYALAIPLLGVYPPGGDEPWFLMKAESLLTDRDLDLRDEYRAWGWQRYEDDPVGPNGEQYSRHERFLSLLILPGFALFGVKGALATIALFGVLLVRSTIRWMEDEGIPDAHARAVFPFFAFGPPLLWYATRVWPEVPAAFFFVEALRGVRAERPRRWIPALVALVLLKLRFGLVAVGLLFRRPQLLAAGAALLLVYFAATANRWQELIPARPAAYLTGLLGLLVDQMGGLAFQAPFYLFGLFALFRWKSAPRGFRAGIIAASLYVLMLLPRPQAFNSWAPPLHYIAFLMPVLALGAAAMWDRLSRGAIAVAALWTVGVAVHGLTWPYRLFHIATGEYAIGEWLSATYRSDFSRLLPSFSRPNTAGWIGAVVVLFLITVGLRRWKHDLTIPLFALALAAGFAHGKKPGARIEFEDTHVVHDGGRLYPEEFELNRFVYRGGWILEAGHSASFLAQRGTYALHFITGLGAVVELEGRAYQVEPHLEYQTVRVVVPHDGRVTLRCLSGAINADFMERE